MHFLIHPLPQSLWIGGRDYPIRTDFRFWILITEVLGDGRLPPMRKLELAAQIAGLDSLPDDRAALASAILEFASCGEKPVSSPSAGASPVFDFSSDGGAIFSAFLRVYHIDLTSETLHWWKFLSLLRDLPPDTEFMSRISLRTMDLSRIEDDNLRRHLRRARARIRLHRDSGREEDIPPHHIQSTHHP